MERTVAIILAELLEEIVGVDDDEGWENERIPMVVWLFGVWLHSVAPIRHTWWDISKPAQ